MPSKLGRQTCWAACLLVFVSRAIQENYWKIRLATGALQARHTVLDSG
jgi:hypothetical protein